MSLTMVRKLQVDLLVLLIAQQAADQWVWPGLSTMQQMGPSPAVL